MNVPARVFASQGLLEEIFRDRSMEQLVNVATLPGIQVAAIAMPDIHEGYGFPIGGVAATNYPDGAISPGGIGYDINCGVRLLKSEIEFEALRPCLEALGQRLYREIPSGVGHGGRLKLEDSRLNRVLEKGVPWTIEQGYGDPEDARFVESSGALPHADSTAVSAHAKDRGRDQLGTMGAGNHFVEIDRIDDICDESIARSFGLFLNQVVLLIHTGSRGLGHQVATDYIRTMLGRTSRLGIALPDRELAYAPLSSAEGTSYFNAMGAAANFAWANRQLITSSVRQVWRSLLGDSGGNLTILYDVAHNVAKIEEHPVNGGMKKLIVHRKGATRAFGPGSEEIGPEYRSTGQPVIIPGSMGSASYVLAGTSEAMKQSFGSSCHGAGRRMSRHAAKRAVQGQQLRAELQGEGIYIQAGSLSGLAEEAPLAYKDIDSVVDVVHQAGIARKVARLKPVVVIKG
ncbi:MAG: RtcB family protein [Bacteroidetes bacterium]|nr:RtcB family protein [Bacteroidota bacterium]MCL5027258.1 RtcB family protein [Chloroflexota bacterium]